MAKNHRARRKSRRSRIRDFLTALPITNDRTKPPATGRTTVIRLCKTCLRPPAIRVAATVFEHAPANDF